MIETYKTIRIKHVGQQLHRTMQLAELIDFVDACVRAGVPRETYVDMGSMEARVPDQPFEYCGRGICAMEDGHKGACKA